MNIPKDIIYDFEAGPNEGALRNLLPPFDPSSVKVGNLGPEKAKEKIEEARSNHETNWRSDAALRPETATILAIGILSEKETILHVNDLGSERRVLEEFWGMFCAAVDRKWIGFNTHSYDLPMVILRSCILDVPVPPNLRNGRYFNPERFIDLKDNWLMGRRDTEFKWSLGYVAKALGVGEKSGSGKFFSELYETDTPTALAYLSNDLKVTQAVARKLGVIPKE